MNQPNPNLKKNTGNPEAVNDAYALFVETGYSKSKDEFVNLISTNEEALNDAYKLFAETGYKKDINEFSNLLGLKKKSGSQSTSTSSIQDTSLALEQTSGSSVSGQKPSQEDFSEWNMSFEKQKQKPSITPDISKGEFSDFDVISKNFSEKTAAKNKNLEVANKAFNYAKERVSTEYAKEKLEDEINTKQFSDGIVDGLKSFYNKAIVAPLNVANEMLGGTPNFFEKAKKYQPLEIEKKQAKEILQSQKEGAVSEIEVEKLAKELFLEKNIQDQMHALIDEALPSGYDREGVWKELKLNALRSNDKLRSKVASVEVFNAKIQEFKEFRQSLSKEQWTEGLSDENTEKYNRLAKEAIEANQYLQSLAKNFDSYLQEAKNDDEKLELFKYNYHDFDKNATLLLNTSENILAGTLKVGADALNFASNRMIQADMPGMSAVSEMASKTISDNEKESGEFFRYKASNINSWGDLGSFASQLISEQVPILASIYLGGNLGTAAVSLGSGGQKMTEIDEEEKRTGVVKYSDAEKLATGILYAGAEFIPERFGTARILKDLERTISSASSASRRLFRESFVKSTFNGIKKSAYNTLLEGGTELITAQSQIVIDENLLNMVKTDSEKNEMRFESFFAGAFMGGAMSVGGGALSFMASQSRLYSDSKDIQDTKKIFERMQFNINEIENNDSLTDQEVQEIFEENSKLSAMAFSIVEKNAKKGVSLGTEEKSFLLDINLQQSQLREKGKEILNSNFSKEYKDSKIKELEAEFNNLEKNRNQTLDGGYNPLLKLSQTEVEQLKDQASKELVQEAQAEGKTEFSFDDKAITDRAVEIYNKQNPAKTSEETDVTEDADPDETVVIDNNDTETTPDTEAQPQQDEVIEDIDETPIVTEVIDSDGVFVYDGEKGNVTMDGQQVVFETKDKIIELGNIDELQDTTLQQLGITVEEALDITVQEDNSVTVNGKTYVNNYSNPAAAINQDKDGNYSVTLETENGQKRTFRGQQAEQIVYQYKLKNFEQNATEQQIDNAIEIADEAIRTEEEVRATAPKRKNKSVRKSRKKQRTLKSVKEPISKNELAPINNPTSEEVVPSVIEPEAIVADNEKPIEKAIDAEVAQPSVDSKNNSKEDPVVNDNQQKIGNENYRKGKNKIKGRTRQITIGDGSKIKGTYYVVSANDIVASHNEETFSSSENFPKNERGETINDRNYETDKNAQNEVVKIAQNFDGRAVQQTPVVTKDGVVVDGNNRTMSRKLAGRNKTDSEYVAALKEEADMYGIDPAQIENIENPILVFEAENELPYTTETLSRFNKQDKKEKSSAGKAVEYSKTLTDRAKRQIAEIYDEVSTPSEVTGNPKLVKRLRDILLDNKIIQSNELPRYFDIDKGVMTKEGVSLMENIALGSVFNEKTINTLSLSGMGDIRTKLLSSLVGLINNSSLNKDFLLSKEIAKAIEVIYQLKITKQNIEEYLDQPDLFGEKLMPNIDEYAVILALSDTGFKSWLKNYNNNIGQPDMFKAEGDPITTKRDITNETVRKQKKQIPSNLRSDAAIDAKENGPENGRPEGEVGNQPENKNDVEPKPDEEVDLADKKYTVRDLAGMQEGEVSAAVFSSLEKGDVFTVGGKTYEVTAKTKGKTVTEFEDKKGVKKSYTKDRLTIKEKKPDGTLGKPISGNLIRYSNGNTMFSGEGSWSNLSRDIEGDITIDLINEYNKFHNKSDSYRLAEKYLDVINNLEINPIKKTSSLEQVKDWLDKADNDLKKFGGGNLSMGIPIVVARVAIKSMKAALNAGMAVADIIEAGLDAVKQTDWYKNLTSKEQKNVVNNFENTYLPAFANIQIGNNRQNENLLSRANSQNVSDKEAYDEFNQMADDAVAQLENKKTFKQSMKDFYKKYVTRFTDRQFTSKNLLLKTGLKNTLNRIIASQGASGKAKMVFEEAYNKIYKGLSRQDRTTLDKVIQAMRFIAIDQNRQDRGLEPVSHPNFIDGIISQKFLNELRNEIGDKKFNDLQDRAKAYFDAYKDLLSKMLDNGLISQEQYDSMSDVDYQPRVFLQFVTDFNGDLDTSGKKGNNDTGGLSQEQIKTMSEGDASALVMNSEWLLTNSLMARYKAMANNNVNKRFITDEFPKALKKFKGINPKNFRNKEEKRFYEYFKELQSKVIDNPVIEINKNGNPVYLYDKAPMNFQRMYYFENGIQKQFFLENEMHESWNNNLTGVFSNGDIKEFISYASGSALVKGIATGNNPSFPIVNTPRDFFFTIAFSPEYSSNVLKSMGQISKDVTKAIMAIGKKKSAVVEKYFEYGGAMDFLSSQGKLKKESYVGRLIDDVVSPNTKDNVKGFINKVTFHKISQYSELMFRIGIFQRSIQNQLKTLGLSDVSQITDKQQLDDLYFQAVASARGILDFNQGGVITKDLEAVIPYINVAFQGGRVAINAFERDPAGTTARVLQIATIMSSVPVGLSLMLIAAMKDDDDERSVHEIYVDALDGVSHYQKQKYMTIFTGTKDKKGQYEFVKIAKSQELTPVVAVTDNIINNMIRRMAGKEERSAKKITKDALSAFNDIMPVDMTSTTKTITRNPLLKAVLTYQTGFDFFREEPLDFNLQPRPSSFEGMNRSDVEDFYKKIGEDYGLSPIRTKAAVESLITSPGTNPLVGFLYGGAEAITSDKDSKEIAKKLGENLFKSTGKRIVGNTSDFNRRLETNKVLQEKIEAVRLQDALRKKEVKELVNGYLDKEITIKELEAKAKEKLSPEDQLRLLKKIADGIRFKNIDRNIIDIKYEQSPDVKALMIFHHYGNILDGDFEDRNIIRQMRIIGDVLTPEVKKELFKLQENLK